MKLNDFLKSIEKGKFHSSWIVTTIATDSISYGKLVCLNLKDFKAIPYNPENEEDLIFGVALKATEPKEKVPIMVLPKFLIDRLEF